jgi:hypothetical protein
LFEILVEMDEQERRDFLEFTTGSNRLPIGGLKNLNPKCKISQNSLSKCPSSNLFQLKKMNHCQQRILVFIILNCLNILPKKF